VRGRDVERRGQIKPRIGKQRIASYNREESRERVHTDSRGDRKEENRGGICRGQRHYSRPT
jgi:hypothetical protein